MIYYMLLLVLLAIIIIAYILRPVYHKPKIIKNFLSPEECAYIKDQASKQLKPSTVSHDKVVDTNVRVSETAWLGLEDPVV